MMSGAAIFKCPLYKHSVTAREFSSLNGSRRTQGARAMNEHAKVAHGCPPTRVAYVLRPLNASTQQVKGLRQLTRWVLSENA
jgi:hypothetical protein